MHEHLDLEVNGVSVRLMGEGAILLRATGSLLIADVHIGKAAHFRKAGLAVPGASARSDMKRLESLIALEEVCEVIFLGDLGHSDYNAEWLSFVEIRNRFSSIPFILVRGNHDASPVSFYKKMGINEVVDSLLRANFFLCHEPPKSHSGAFFISGHVHPAVRLKSNARQQMVLTCFYFSKSGCILPAFTRFSGKFVLDLNEEDRAFPIAKGKVVSLPNIAPVNYLKIIDTFLHGEKKA